MAGFDSKYSGAQVEALLDQVASGNAGGGGGGGIDVETDPIFSASPAASITEAKKTEWDNKMDKVTLATVATSGNYNDLSNKPTIPSAVTESTVSGWGFTKNTGTYSKPSGGIPTTDLASSVQTSLGKANTALQGSEASGEIDDVESGGSYVKYDGVQSLSEAQKAQARANIDAVSTAELQRVYNELLSLINGGAVATPQMVLDEAALDKAILR